MTGESPSFTNAGMSAVLKTNFGPHASVEIVDKLGAGDLAALCEAAESAIENGGGFGWVTVPPRESLERYWKGVLVVPGRHLMVARLDGVICGALQLIEPSRYNEAQSFSAGLLALFVAPWARRCGAARKLVETAETLATELGYKVLQIDIRETQAPAIALYERLNYQRWGRNPLYAQVRGTMVAGVYYQKNLKA